MKIQFLGAAGMVTGSGYLLTSKKGSSILIDFGLFQESGWVTKFNFDPLVFDPKTLTGVFLTHAHLDHCGRLPLLAKNGYTGNIYTTAATKDITTLSLIDAAHIAIEDKHDQILYTVDDVEKTVSSMIPVVYDKQFDVSDFSIVFHNAGHILGSASILVTEKETGKTIIFSGDLGNTPEDLIAPTEFFVRADVIIMESTYGEREHPQEDPSAVLQSEINTVEKAKGVLLIPAFSIERSQEIIHRIGLLKKEGKIAKETPVFLDSPMAIQVTEIFKKYNVLYNKTMAKEKNPFSFDNLMFTQSSQESKTILECSNPKVIIAGSGMLSGGRILHHLVNYIANPLTRILFAGYQAANTLGRLIIDGAKDIKIYRETFHVGASVTQIQSLSSHADQPKLLNWLSKIKGVQKVFLTHGEDMQRLALMEKIRQNLHLENVFLPKKDEVFDLD